jgi:hypothetical protein
VKRIRGGEVWQDAAKGSSRINRVIASPFRQPDSSDFGLNGGEDPRPQVRRSRLTPIINDQDVCHLRFQQGDKFLVCRMRQIFSSSFFVSERDEETMGKTL